MHKLPYPAATLWACIAIALILAANAVVLMLALHPGAFGWLIGPNSAFALKMLLHPSPWITWLRGGLLPWDDASRLLKHGYLHAGWGHLLYNMVPLAVLGWLTARRVGTFGFILLYHLLMVLAALGYLWAMKLTADGVLNAGNYFLPLAGASGAVHGLAGLWVVWAIRVRRSDWSRAGIAQRIWPAAVWLGFVMAVNIVTYALMDGAFAWALHIAGVLIGAALALLIPARKP